MVDFVRELKPTYSEIKLVMMRNTMQVVIIMFLEKESADETTDFSNMAYSRPPPQGLEPTQTPTEQSKDEETERVVTRTPSAAGNAVAVPQGLEPTQTPTEQSKDEETERVVTKTPSAAVPVQLHLVLSLHDINCNSHPGHRSFIPILSSKPLDLMPGFRSDSWVKFLKLKGHETVRINVHCTPLDKPGSEDYPFRPTPLDKPGSEDDTFCHTPLDKSGSEICSVRGCKDNVCHGSGTAFIKGMDKEQRCPFDDCPIPKPHNVSGGFKVVTAAHMLVNDAAALRTRVFFFHDEEHSPVVEARGLRITSVDKVRNRAVLECVTHDLSLNRRVTEYRKRLQELGMKLRREFVEKPVRFEVAVQETTMEEKMVVILSHPHGRAKHISVGSLVSIQRVDTPVALGDLNIALCVLSYSTPACPGSDGGSVVVLCPRLGCVGFAPHFASESDHSVGVSGLGWVLD